MCLKLRTVAASNNRDHTPRSLYYCLFAPRICGVVLRANSVRGEPHIQRNVSGVVATTETSYSYVHIVLALRLPGVTVGYYLSNFAFYVQCLTVVRFHSQALTLQGKFEIHESLKVFRCCLGSPSKSGHARPHLVASLFQPFLIKLKLHLRVFQLADEVSYLLYS